MAALAHQDSRRMYSWWWDSHISPKNSRWLQENLTDMDSKVKGMIKLINEDADSFARRAEMYYKKRPELMKFVEEFYRAYRALAERYDHATGVIRHAHRTMTEAFPNQVPLGPEDDSPAGSDPQTPMLTPMRGFFEPDELRDSSSHTHDLKSNGASTDESHSVTKRRGLKQRSEFFGAGDQGRFSDGRVRKGLNFSDTEESGAQTNESNGFQTRALPDSGYLVESEEILTLKKAIAEVEAEKEAGLIQYQQTLEKLSQLESEISRAKEDSQGFAERASKAEAEAQTLKEALSSLGAEKEANLQQYQKSLDRISELENTISKAEENAVALVERTGKAELEAQSLREDLAKVATEKDENLKQYMLSLETIAKLENKLQCAEEDGRKLSERAEKAESEVESLKQEILKLTGEKEDAALQLQKCLETISSLEKKLSCAQEEAQRLNAEISDGVAKLEGAEERCLLLERSNKSLHSELESLTLKMGSQSLELTEKQKELGKLWSCVQDERLRFVEAETAFQTLQHLHAKCQEEMRALALELQNRVQVLKDLETQNQKLQGEVQKVKEENNNLNEVNVSSAISMRDMQTEISRLREEKGNLEVEVELRVDQRNALQQEIYCLKEELNDQNKKLLSMVTQVQAVGFDPESFESSVKELQDEKSNLKETCERERSEKVALLEKLKVLEELLEKNSILENSLSDLSAELEAVRGNLQTLEESCQSLLEEKSALLNDKATLTSELRVTIENLEKVSAKNTVLENSLSDAHVELQSLKVKTKSLEDSSEVLAKEKEDLTREKGTLISQLQAANVALNDLEERYSGLEQRHTALEKERALTLDTLEELRISLDAKNCEHDRFVHMSEARLAGMESEMHFLLEECQLRKQEFDELLEKATESDILNCTLQTSALDLEGKGSSLLREYQKLHEASILSETLISELKQKNAEQKMETTSLFDQVSVLRTGIIKLLKALDIVPKDACQDMKDQVHLDHIFHRVEVTKDSFYKAQEENHQSAIQMNVLVTLLEQLKLEVEQLVSEKTVISRESSIRSEQLLALQIEATKLKEGSEELKLKIMEKDHKEELLEAENCNLGKALQLAEDDLKTVRSTKDQLNLQISADKSLLSEKDIELQGMEEKLYLSEAEKSVFHQILKNLSRELMGSKMIVDDQEKKIMNLCADSNRLRRENVHLFEASQLLQEGLHQSRIELEKLKMQEEALCAELKKQLKEIETSKLETDVLLGELQVAMFYHILYEQKIHELSEVCQSFGVQITSKDKDMKILEEKVNTLGTENEDLNTQLAAYGPAILSLSQCISSLEKHSCLNGKLQKPDTDDTKDILVVNPVDSSQLKDNENAVATDAFSDLHGLEARVRAVEKALVEMDQLVVQENVNMHSKLQAAVQQIEELRSESNLHRRNSAPKSEIFEAESGILTKDIMLDHVSECSPYRIGSRKQAETDNLVFDLWDTTNPTVSKAKMNDTPNAENDFEFHKRVPAVKKKYQHAASEVLGEKDRDDGKLNISKRSSESTAEGNKRKVLERLDSDVQKLTNLQITVHDLKRELEITEKGKRGKAVAESETLKGQLNEAEAAIHKLFDLAGKLMKNMEDSFSSSDMKSALESEEIGNVSRRRISEQARRISEKIGRLQLEVQKLQFVLVKLNDESKGTSRYSEAKRRVLLRDYLYGGVRKSNRRKRAPFCACIQPPTQGD